MSRNAFGTIEREQIRNDALRDQEKTERAAAAARPVITDEQRVAWMRDRITYLEHKSRDGVSCSAAPVGQYWPQGEYNEDNADENMIGLALIDYIDAQIAMEAKS